MSRKIAIFCDGTWQKDDQKNQTNVSKLFEACGGVNEDPRPDDDVKFHIDGVGTDNFIDKLLGGTFGIGLSDDVKKGYRYICENYRKGDEIYLIGFSRGAYTARSIGGMIGTIGIINLNFYPADLNVIQDIFQRDQEDVIDEAFEFYRTPPAERDDTVLRRIRRIDFDPVVQAIGVFDTVGALGIPVLHEDSPINRRFQFHDVTLGSIVRNAFHAVAIDEQRYPFRATLWQEHHDRADKQKIEQVWFPGDHGDIGGGKPKSAAGLSNIALMWMANRLTEAGLDLDLQSLDAGNKIDLKKPADTGMAGIWTATGEYQRDVGYPGFAGQAIHEAYKKKLKTDRKYPPIANPLKDYGRALDRVNVPPV